MYKVLWVSLYNLKVLFNGSPSELHDIVLTKSVLKPFTDLTGVPYLDM